MRGCVQRRDLKGFEMSKHPVASDANCMTSDAETVLLRALALSEHALSCCHDQGSASCMLKLGSDLI